MKLKPFVGPVIATLTGLVRSSALPSARTNPGKGMAKTNDLLLSGAPPAKPNTISQMRKPLKRHVTGMGESTTPLADSLVPRDGVGSTEIQCKPTVMKMPLRGLPGGFANILNELEFGSQREDPLIINKEIYVPNAGSGVAELSSEKLQAAMGKYHKDDVLAAVFIVGGNITAPANATLGEVAVSSNRCAPLCKQVVSIMSEEAKAGMLAGALVYAKGIAEYFEPLVNGTAPLGFQTKTANGTALGENAFAVGEPVGSVAAQEVMAQTNNQLFSTRTLGDKPNVAPLILDNLGDAIANMWADDSFLDHVEPEVKLLLAATIQNLPYGGSPLEAPFDQEGYRDGINAIGSGLVNGDKSERIAKSISSLLGGISPNATDAEVKTALSTLLKPVPFRDSVNNLLYFDPRNRTSEQPKPAPTGSPVPPPGGTPSAPDRALLPLLLGISLIGSLTGNILLGAKLKSARNAARDSALPPPPYSGPAPIADQNAEAVANQDPTDADDAYLAQNPGAIGMTDMTRTESLPESIHNEQRINT